MGIILLQQGAVMTEQEVPEAMLMIDEFIHKISGQSIVEVSVVIDHLLDIRNSIQSITVPV